MEKEKNTIIERAKREVSDFSSMYSLLEQKVILGGLSQSTLKKLASRSIPTA